MELDDLLRKRYYELDKLIESTRIGTPLSYSLQIEKEKVKALLWQRKITDELSKKEELENGESY